MPFEAGWYAVVRILEQSSSLVNESKIADSNCDPLSVVIVRGVPNLAIHVDQIAFTTSSAVVDAMGAASGHLENLSIIVRQ